MIQVFICSRGENMSKKRMKNLTPFNRFKLHPKRLTWENVNKDKLLGIGILGKWKVFQLQKCVDNGEDTIQLLTNLPGIKKELKKFKTELEGIEYAEAAVEYWINKANLK